MEVLKSNTISLNFYLEDKVTITWESIDSSSKKACHTSKYGKYYTLIRAPMREEC